MKISVHSLKGRKFFRFQEPADAFPILKEMAASRACEFTSPVTIALSFYRVNDMYRGEGRVETTLRLPCSRCLEDFDYSVCAECIFNFTAEPDGAESPPGEFEINAEQAGLVTFREDEIDLTESVQDQIVMALPIQPLCKEDCPGLCPQCGTSLNQGPCHCPKAVFNPKFQSLASLQLDKKKKP